MVIIEKAPAKINLYLGVYRQKDARGYHRVDSVMVGVGLFDEVRVCESDHLAVTMDPEAGFPQEKNTAYRAAALMAEALGRKPGVQILISKRIPEQSGLGGSSSDAAAVLRALCRIWHTDVRDPAVREVARAVGADVPYFLEPGWPPALLVGAGDLAKERFPALGAPVVLLRPEGEGVSTRDAYQRFDEIGQEAHPVEGMLKALRASDATAVARALYNNLDPIACDLRPAVREAREWLRQQDGVLGAQVTGSGSCIFAICESAAAADSIARAANERPGWWARQTSTW